MCIYCIDSLLLQVIDIQWPRKKNGLRQNFAFVVFQNEAEAEAASRLRYQTIGDCRVLSIYLLH